MGEKTGALETNRPHIFLKELSLYITHLQDKLDAVKVTIDRKQFRYLLKFKKSLD